MATLKTNLIEPEGATTTLTVGEAGGNLVIGADSLKVNTAKSKTEIITSTFTSTPGGGTWTVPAGVTSVEYLVVGGGGSGGIGYGPSGGGGAGGFRTGTLSVTPAAALTVTVGAGGASQDGTSAPAGPGNDGANSVFGSITAAGGGGGGGNGPTGEGNDGGSGGGAYFGDNDNNKQGSGNTPSTSPAQGFDGGNGGKSTVSSWAAGGGGGAGAAGGNAEDSQSSPNDGGGGGIGKASSITGNYVFYAGGGGGAIDESGDRGLGGRGGGGDGCHKAGGAPPGVQATDATANTGGGGGGAGWNNTTANATSGAGGSGIVVLKYAAQTPQTLFTSNGSGVVSSVDSGWGGVQTLIQSQTITNGALMEFTSGIDSTYQEYMFEFLNVHPVTSNNINFEWQANASGQSGYNERMDSTFFVAQLRNNNSSAALQYDASGDRANETTYQPMALGIGNLLKESGSGELHIFNPASTTYTKQWYGKMHIYHASDYSINNYSAGYINTTAAITQISFQFNTGNFSGTIKMYGIQ